MKTKYFLFLLSFISLWGLTACDDEEDNGLAIAADVVSVEDITYQSAEVTGMIVGDATLISAYGFCYGENMDPTVDDTNIEFTNNEEFEAAIALNSKTKYYLRSYVKTSSGIIYSANRFFTTPKVNVILLSESFETELAEGWTTIDKDGDGYNWYHSTTGGGCMSSQSWADGGAITPENYLVSPMISIPQNAATCQLTFEVAAGWLNYHFEQYRVVASTEPITIDNCQSATIVKDYVTLTDAHADYIFQPDMADLSDFVGQDVYFAIVHGNCTDNDRFFLKNIEVRAFE